MLSFKKQSQDALPYGLSIYYPSPFKVCSCETIGWDYDNPLPTLTNYFCSNQVLIGKEALRLSPLGAIVWKLKNTYENAL